MPERVVKACGQHTPATFAVSCFVFDDIVPNITLAGAVDETRALIRPAPVEAFDEPDAARTDVLLAGAGR